MQLLLFELEKHFFALDSKEVIEIIPLLKLTSIPKAPGYVKGVFNYRGTAVPVIDLSSLIENTDTPNILSSRIILVNYKFKNDKKILGIISRRVVEILKVDDNLIDEVQLNNEESKFLSKVIKFEKRMVHIVEVTNLLNENVKNLLFSE
ncbi:MAG: chemotaxis protein CheW [Melioribacteraceae bacterium]|nr:chemotaxis protein CheW [Melioribacteraceae bacterium]MCF8354004.1 chemotaxis protein CheW [Melioribacteraceae bacterium]MCF8392315.1 chemotaxis protein CheW [Melioribacteraceae bacterium]MCF8417647.1 chemotaxis protein CheW [Melioribacteraceae bacterium]